MNHKFQLNLFIWIKSGIFKCDIFKVHTPSNWGGFDAFPDDIPNEILSGKNDHSKPLPDQSNDFVFENIDFDVVEI